MNIASVISIVADADDSIIVGELVVAAQILESLLDVVIRLTIAESRGERISAGLGLVLGDERVAGPRRDVVIGTVVEVWVDE